MIQRCWFGVFDGDKFLGFKKGYFAQLIQLGMFKSSLLKKEAFGIPRGVDILDYKGHSLLLVDVATHMAFSKGESLIPDPDLVDVLSNICEDKIWKHMGSTNISLWQMLALMGAGAGVLGAVLLIIQLLK